VKEKDNLVLLLYLLRRESNLNVLIYSRRFLLILMRVPDVHAWE
jgi:hypothetical protein